MNAAITFALLVVCTLAYQVQNTPSFGSPHWQNGLFYDSHPNVISIGKNNSFAFGRRQYGDRLDFVYVAYKKPSWMRRVTENVTYPAKGHLGMVITCVEVLDKQTDHSGDVSLLRGGVNWRNTVLGVKSERGYGYHYRFSIYGKPY